MKALTYQRTYRGRLSSLHYLMYATFLTLLSSSVSAQYDENLAYKGVMYSGAAYCSYDDLDVWDCGDPCKKTKGI